MHNLSDPNMMNQKTNSRSPSRANRTSANKLRIYEVLDEGLFCTVAYVKDGRPYQIPTGYCRMDDKLLIHGSSGIDLLEDLRKVEEVCISIMLFDGLVLAPTAVDHSVNYRSVMIFSKPEEVNEEETKASFFEAFTEKYVPGRMTEVQPPSSEEMAVTTVLSFGLDNATAETRKGPVGVDTRKSDVWSGIVPASVAYGIPETDKAMKKGVRIPRYLTQMVVKSNT